MHGTNTHTQINRRTLLTAAPIAALSSALLAGDVNAAVAQVLAESDTPVMRLFREWERLIETALRDGCTDDGNADDAYWDPVFDIEGRIMVTPSQDARDWIAKALAKSNSGRVELDSSKYNPELWAEARAMVGGAA